MLNPSSITLLKSRPAWKGIRWHKGPQIRRVESLDQVVRAMANVTVAAASIARIVIEEAIDGTEFLSLIANLPPEFPGDILLIASPSRAFLSSRAGGGPRYLILFTPQELEGYLDAFSLRDSAAGAELPLLNRLRILVAEDEKKTREFLVGILDRIGCETIVASAGFEAVRVTQERRPQIIILDGLLPEMHGFEIARFVRGVDPSYRPRIILVTAVYKHTRYQSEARLKYGVDYYLVKPVTRDQIANAIFGEPPAV
jgi:CheY-like chemotaxis protein